MATENEKAQNKQDALRQLSKATEYLVITFDENTFDISAYGETPLYDKMLHILAEALQKTAQENEDIMTVKKMDINRSSTH